MTKAILLSIKPKYVAKILNGEKTIEIRKTMPKCDLPIDVYIYCTKGKPRAILTDKGCVLANKLSVGGNSIYKSGYSLEGQVVAKFTLRKVEEIEFLGYEIGQGYNPKEMTPNEMANRSCLFSFDDIHNYLKGKNGYAWHIEDLVIFDEPKELSDFMPVKWNKCGVKDKNGLYQCHKCPYGEVLSYGGECHYKPLKKAPQSYCFVESEA